jgi:hypothetical protein
MRLAEREAVRLFILGLPGLLLGPLAGWSLYGKLHNDGLRVMTKALVRDLWESSRDESRPPVGAIVVTVLFLKRAS